MDKLHHSDANSRLNRCFPELSKCGFSQLIGGGGEPQTNLYHYNFLVLPAIHNRFDRRV